MSHWLEGRWGKFLGGLAFGMLIYNEFDYSYQAALLDLSNDTVWRWRTLLIVCAFGLGLAIQPPVPFMTVFGGGIIALFASGAIFLLMAGVHWANTGEIVDNVRWLQFALITIWPISTAYWTWKLLRKESPKEAVVVSATIKHPLVVLLIGILTVISSLLAARARFGMTWEQFFGLQ